MLRLCIGLLAASLALAATGDPLLTGGRSGAIQFTFDGAGSVLEAAAPAACVVVEEARTVTSWDVYADASGSITLDVWKSTYADLPIADADRIAGTDKPLLSTAQKNTSSALTGWTTAIAAGDWVCAEIEGTPATVTQVWLSINTDL